MNKEDIWLPRKIVPMLGKITGSEADAFNHMGLFPPGHKLTIAVSRNQQHHRLGSLAGGMAYSVKFEKVSVKY